jgi:hypothetical protein
VGSRPRSSESRKDDVEKMVVERSRRNKYKSKEEKAEYRGKIVDKYRGRAAL